MQVENRTLYYKYVSVALQVHHILGLMFTLKKMTAFKTYTHIYSTDKYVYAVSKAAVDILSPCLMLQQTFTITDLIQDTACHNNKLYIMTPKTLLVFANLNFNKHSLERVYKKFFIYKNVLLFCNQKTISVYSQEVSLQYTLNMNYDDICTDDTYIYILHNEVIQVYEYYDRIMIRKDGKHDCKLLSCDASDNRLWMVRHKGVFYVFNAMSYFVYMLELYVVACDQSVYILQKDSLCKTTSDITFVSPCENYAITNDQINPLRINNRTLATTEVFDTQPVGIQLPTCLALFIEDTNEIILWYLGKFYKIVKQRALVNIRNIKLTEKIDESDLMYCLPDKKLRNIEIITTANMLRISNLFIYCSKLQDYYVCDNSLLLVNDKNILIYEICWDYASSLCFNTRPLTIQFCSKFAYDKLLCVCKDYLYFCHKSKYFILDIRTRKMMLYIKKDVIAISKSQEGLCIYEKECVWLYKVYDERYSKIMLPENSNTKTQFYDKFAKRTTEMHMIAADCVEYQALNGVDYVNIKHKGIHVYKNDKLLTRDFIDRTVVSFFVHNGRIYMNDNMKYLIVTSLDFEILAIVYIDTYVTDWFVKTKAVFCLSVEGNVYKITDIGNDYTGDERDYYDNHIKVNFAVT